MWVCCDSAHGCDSPCRDMFWRENLSDLTLLPGDTIMVPAKLKGPNPYLQQLPIYTEILSQVAMTGAALGTSY